MAPTGDDDERRVGVAQESVRGRRAIGHGDPDGPGRHDPVPLDLEILADRSVDAFRSPLHIHHVIDLGHDDHELVTAEPSEAFPGVKATRDPSAHLGQYLVAGNVTQRVVDDLEVVQIDEQHAHVLTKDLGVLEILRQHLHDPRPVLQTGQRVVEGLEGERLLRLALGRHILHLQQEEGRVAVPGVEAHRRHLGPRRRAVGSDQSHLVGER